jgi:1,4-alpha-glucan branching enzyme
MRQWGTLLFDYGKPEVRSFLTSSAVYWLQEMHMDALRVDAVSCMLYMDFGRDGGDWLPNSEGGREDLSAIALFKHLAWAVHSLEGHKLLIAEESTAFPKVTDKYDDSLGFDFKWNKGFKDALIEYMQLDPIFRGPHHQELIFSMVYNYSEQFLLSFGWADMTHGYGSMYAKVPGKKKTKLANLRAAYGYTILHPGKKLLAMGCDIAQKKGFSPTEGVVWESLDDEENVTFQTYMAALLRFYRENPALWALDSDPEGFEWINNISAGHLS